MDHIAAGTGDSGILIVGMYILLHIVFSPLYGLNYIIMRSVL